jgi:antitoxin MazE6
MSNVKTAISIDAALFKQVEAAAHEMNVSRSRLFALAVQEFLRQRENQQLVARLDEVYSGDRDPEDELLLKGMRRIHRRILENGENEW